MEEVRPVLPNGTINTTISLALRGEEKTSVYFSERQLDGRGYLSLAHLPGCRVSVIR
jgi:hypothetical protein